MAINQKVCTQVALTTSGNEYSLVIPSRALGLQIRLQQTTGTVKVYNTSVGNGGSPANYVTIDSSRPIIDRGACGGQTLYLMGSVNTLTVEAFYTIDN